MKTFASALLLLAAINLGIASHAAPSAAQTDDVREAVFRALFVRAKAIMPDTKVYILQKETPHPPVWGNMSDFDPDAGLLQTFADIAPRVIPFSRSNSVSSAEGIRYQEAATEALGGILQIVSLHWFSDTSVEAETDIEAGLPRPDVSRPYLVTLQQGQWTAREDVRREWWQAVHEGDIREAVVRYELTKGIYGVKPRKSPCYLSFGGYADALRVDPPEAFMERFAHDPIRLLKASECPAGRKPWMMFGIQDVRWISDKEAEVDAGGTHSNSMSTESDLCRVTQGKDGWDVQLLSMISV